MSAVVRVKRRMDEEPLSAFVLNCKRRRTEDDAASSGTSKDEISTLLKFAGTIREQDNTATTEFARLTKDFAKELVLNRTKTPGDIIGKARKATRQHQHEQRFRVVNRLRTNLEDERDEITIVDIEKEQNPTNDKTADSSEDHIRSLQINETINTSEPSTSAAAAARTMPADSDIGYVYDLYMLENEQLANHVDLMEDNFLSVHALNDLVYEECYQDMDDDENDSEDSNQENHIANDYPDEDDSEDFDSDECHGSVLLALEKLGFPDDSDEVAFYDSDRSSQDGSDAYYNPYAPIKPNRVRMDCSSYKKGKRNYRYALHTDSDDTDDSEDETDDEM